MSVETNRHRTGGNMPKLQEFDDTVYGSVKAVKLTAAQLDERQKAWFEYLERLGVKDAKGNGNTAG